jgi:protoheme IX farnesyltransferase
MADGKLSEILASPVSAPALDPGATILFPGREAAAPATIAHSAAEKTRTWIGIFAELFKARLTFLVLVTTLVGFYLGAHGGMQPMLMFHTLLGTALVAAGASALNQWWERDYDALMRRTRSRPLPAGQLQPLAVLVLGLAFAAAGLVYLVLAVNLATCLLGAASLLTYVLVYTPLKRVTWLNTAVGAIPGGLPPLMGWTAAHGSLSAEGWTLFAILALWQLPHFMAIAWIYRDEYTGAGFQMLPRVDPTGVRTSRQAFVQTLGLLPLSLCPFFLKMTGPVYLCGALALGLGFVWFGIQFARQVSVARARQLFLASILYLPLLLVLMAVDKIR